MEEGGTKERLRERRTHVNKEGIHMLSAKHAALAIKILSLSLIAALSFFVATAKLPESQFVQQYRDEIFRRHPFRLFGDFRPAG